MTLEMVYAGVRLRACSTLIQLAVYRATARVRRRMWRDHNLDCQAVVSLFPSRCALNCFRKWRVDEIEDSLYNKKCISILSAISAIGHGVKLQYWTYEAYHGGGVRYKSIHMSLCLAQSFDRIAPDLYLVNFKL